MRDIFCFIRANLKTFFEKNGRDFPWRHTHDPYHIMIAEFMLQRTKAEQVAPIYLEFLKKYPDVYSLATASVHEIKHLLYPLGLHWRVKHFKESAKYIVENFNGKFPDNRKDLLKIPGVGDYVAGAILVLAYRKREYVVDSNIARFLNRYFGLSLTGEIRRKNTIKKLAQKLFYCDSPNIILFSILDFTALICTPRNPKCNICVLQKSCGCSILKKISSHHTTSD